MMKKDNKLGRKMEDTWQLSRHKSDRGEKKKFAYVCNQKTVYHHLCPLSKHEMEDEKYISVPNG